MYEPRSLSNQFFAISPETVFFVHRAESAVIRTDEKLKVITGNGLSLSRTICKIEALFAVGFDGITSSMESLLWDDAVSNAAFGKPRQDLLGLAPRSYLKDKEDGSVDEVQKYIQAVEWIENNVEIGTLISSGMLLEINQLCRTGSLQNKKAAFRNSFGIEGYINLNLPDPDDIPDMVDDLCVFINSKQYQPIVQACIIHFQLECIQPFEQLNDRTGLLIAHALFRRRGLIEGQVPIPISWGGFIDARYRIGAQHPYIQMDFDERYDMNEAMNEWIVFGARNTEAGAGLIGVYAKALNNIREEWKTKLGKVPRNSALESLVSTLLETPIITTRQAMAITGKSFSATNAALNRLEKEHVVECRMINNKERLFIAGDVCILLNNLERKLLTTKGTYGSSSR